MAKKLKFYDEAPDRRTSARLIEIDDLLLQLIDHPGKWAMLEERENPSYRTTTSLKARGGNGFKFTTTLNPETGLVEVWGSYHPDAS